MARWLVLAVVVLSPVLAFADDEAPVDARLQGYKQPMAPTPGSTSFQWLCFVGLGIVGMGVMFINAKRSHLD